MQKDIQKSKGETFESKPSTDKPTVGETAGHKLKQVGHDVNKNLKENVGVGVGNYSSNEDRKKSEYHEKKYEEKKDKLKEQAKDKKEEIKCKATETKEDIKETTGPIGHKVQEIAHDVNATLKQNIGIGVGNYSSEVDEQRAEEHKERYEKKMQDVKEKVQDKKEEIKDKLGEKKEELKEKAYEGQTGLYTHRIQEVGHTINAKLKDTIGVGAGDYSSEIDRQKASEHWEEYQEKVKETSTNLDVNESSIPIVHKIKEVAHTVNANLKELIGVGVGNYSSEVDRELSEIHHKKYEEKVTQINTNQDQNSPSIEILAKADAKEGNLEHKKVEKKEKKEKKLDEKKDKKKKKLEASKDVTNQQKDQLPKKQTDQKEEGDNTNKF